MFESRPADNWEYLFHQWLGTQDQALADGGTALWVGIDQYLSHRVNKAWAWGARFERFQDTDGTRVGLDRPSNPTTCRCRATSTPSRSGQTGRPPAIS